jgi:hypothetical protein
VHDVNLDEEELNIELKRLRSMAEVLGHLLTLEAPELQAKESLTGNAGIYKAVFDLLIPAASTRERQELMKELERLTRILSPGEVIKQLFLDPLGSMVLNAERALAEKGYPVPGWDRPAWLAEIEG